MRRKVVAGNWKMNMTPSEAVALVKELKPNMENSDVDVIFCVPSIDIVPVVEACKGTKISVGAENMYYEEKGAYTGEVSPQMLVDAGVSYVIIGHSERRQYFKEDNEMVNRKIRKAIEHDIIPIICCGETLEEREAGITLTLIKKQIVSALKYVSPENAQRCIIAYEPIWALERGEWNYTAGTGGMLFYPWNYPRYLWYTDCGCYPYFIWRQCECRQRIAAVF